MSHHLHEWIRASFLALLPLLSYSLLTFTNAVCISYPYSYNFNILRHLSVSLSSIFILVFSLSSSLFLSLSLAQFLLLTSHLSRSSLIHAPITPSWLLVINQISQKKKGVKKMRENSNTHTYIRSIKICLTERAIHSSTIWPLWHADIPSDNQAGQWHPICRFCRFCRCCRMSLLSIVAWFWRGVGEKGRVNVWRVLLVFLENYHKVMVGGVNLGIEEFSFSTFNSLYVFLVFINMEEESEAQPLDAILSLIFWGSSKQAFMFLHRQAGW